MRKLDAAQSITLPLTQLQDNEKRIQSRTQNFAKQFIEPIVGEMDCNAKLNKELIKQLFEYKYMGIEIPRVYGGQALSFMHTILVIEELARIDPSVAVFVDVQNTLVAGCIEQFANDDQKNRFFPLLARNTVGAFSLTEKNAGSDAYALECEAVEVEGGYVLTGEKDFVTNAHEANLFVIFANVHPDMQREGITAFLVLKDNAKALSIATSGDKLGIRASSTCSLSLQETFVPRENILGNVGQGGQIAIEILTGGRIGIAAQMLGLAQGALDLSIDYAKKRKQFGKSIANYQGVYFQIADMAVNIEAARLLVYNAARQYIMNKNALETFSASCKAKLYASRIAEHIASKAVEIFGGKGYMKDYRVEKFYRDAKIGTIYEGTTNMQLRSIAKTLMQLKD